MDNLTTMHKLRSAVLSKYTHALMEDETQAIFSYKIAMKDVLDMIDAFLKLEKENVLMENNQETFIDRLKKLQEQASVLIQELEANPNFPEGHVITKESWDNADKIIHDGFVYVKYSDLLFYK